MAGESNDDTPSASARDAGPDEVRRRLRELGLDLHRIWRHTRGELWGRLDPELWELTHNRWVVLQSVSDERLAELASDDGFCALLDQVWSEHRGSQDRPRWFDREHRDPALHIAYFSMEYMLSEALPIYSGGLGNVAGDQLKAASDLGVPVVGVGLLYQQGYFRQLIDPDGNQRAVYPYNDPMQLPISPVRDEHGDWVHVTVPFAGSPVRARAWQAQVGRVVLYLLDTNVPANRPDVRGITSELYGGGHEVRLAQEILLGIGGWRLLRALGTAPDVCHLNEGHAAFVVLERARDLADAAGCSLHEALVTTRAGNLFTTHTPVDAGFDRFPVGLVRRYLGRYLTDELGVDPDEILALGHAPGAGDAATFNMAHLAVRGSGAVNGVSTLHGEVSRRLFADLFPRWPLEEIPVTSVTNGIHTPTWIDSAADRVWEQARGGAVSGETWSTATDLRGVADDELWRMRSSARAGLVEFVRTRVARQLADAGATTAEVARRTDDLFDPNALTIGFARRFATYKRPNLLLTDPDRLARILSDPSRPVQLIVAGKAHPDDVAGQAMVRDWVQFVRRPDVAGSVVFLADSDMLLTRQLVEGVDLWVNTPRRPWEASGTSGMKVLANGGLNLSVLDGWWAEAYEPGRGWAIGDPGAPGEGPDTSSDEATDAAEAQQLYHLLEHEILPRFFERDRHGIPHRWIEPMRASMTDLTAHYSAERTVKQYTEEHYLPLAARYRERAAHGARLGREIAAQLDATRHALGRLQATRPTVEHDDCGTRTAQLFAYLDGTTPEAVHVELYARATTPGGEPVRLTMEAAEALIGSTNGFRYECLLPADRPFEDFTARVTAWHPTASIPLEAPDVVWLD